MSTLILVGCGNMGYAMLKGWLASDPSLDAHVVEPAEALRTRAADTGANAVASVEDLPQALSPDLIFLAVKPQVMSEVVPALGAPRIKKFGSRSGISLPAPGSLPHRTRHGYRRRA